VSCQCEGYASQFDEAHAADDLRRYRRKGPDKTTRLLLDGLEAQGVRGASVLDVGAGIGVVHHELLDAGAERAIHVDATAANIRTAETESERRGHSGRVTFRQGDFVALAADIPATDIVTLDRVICCYPDMEQLVSASASHARRLYGAVFPRERVVVRAWVALGNWFRGLRGNAFRAYIHPVAAIDAALTSRGFTRRSLRETLVWRVVVYARTSIPEGPQ